MQATWQTFLERQGARMDSARVTDFGDPEPERAAALAGNVLADLSHCGLLTAQGADAVDFLQGQFSNDIGQVTAQHGQLNAYCSPKGRMLAIFLLFRRGNVFYLRMPGEILDGFVKRLHMFVLRAQVTLEDAGETLARFGISGPDAAESLQTLAGAVPKAPYEVTQQDLLTVIRVPGPQPRFELYGPADVMESSWEQLAKTCTPVGAGPWELLDILAGIPVVYPATVDAFVPQMANLDAVGGVNFKKGCYPGQEIVARTQYLGKLKRRMVLGRIQSTQPPQAGGELFDASGDITQAAGRIVSAQAHPDGGYAVLAVLQMSAAKSGEVRLGDDQGPVFSIEKLPYPIK